MPAAAAVQPAGTPESAVRNWLATTLLALTAVAPAAAGPLKGDRIPADAAWVVHIDVEAGVASQVGGFAVAHRAQWGPGACDEFVAKTGIEPTRDIKSVTIYGPTCDEDHAVAVIDATSATDTFLEKLRAEEPTFTRIQGEKYLVDTWIEHGSPRFGYVRKDGDSRLVMVSRDRARLEEAIALSEKSGGAVASPALATPPRKGSFVYVSAVGLDAAAKAGNAKVVQKMQDLHLDLGEAEGALYGRMLITTATRRDADQVLQMMQGAVTIWRVMAQKSPELAPVVDASQALSMTASDSGVLAEFTLDSRKAIDMLRTVAETHAPANSQPDKGAIRDASKGPR
jgi:hypothetical protein